MSNHHVQVISCVWVCVHSAFIWFLNLTLLCCSPRKGNTAFTERASFLTDGALQLAVCCCKPKYELSICILLIETSYFVLISLTSETCFIDFHRNCSDVWKFARALVRTWCMSDVWLVLTLTVHTVQSESVCVLILCSQQLCVHRPMYACVQSQLVQICASMCHSESWRLVSIKAANRWSGVRAMPEFSAPSSSVIGHT